MVNEQSREVLTSLARNMIWWKAPEQALCQPQRLLAQVMALGTWDDVQMARQIWTAEDFRAVLTDAPPGVFDARSWAYWHTVLNVYPLAPLPKRRLG